MADIAERLSREAAEQTLHRLELFVADPASGSEWLEDTLRADIERYLRTRSDFEVALGIHRRSPWQALIDRFLTLRSGSSPRRLRQLAVDRVSVLAAAAGAELAELTPPDGPGEGGLDALMVGIAFALYGRGLSSTTGIVVLRIPGSLLLPTVVLLSLLLYQNASAHEPPPAPVRA